MSEAGEVLPKDLRRRGERPAGRGWLRGRDGKRGHLHRVPPPPSRGPPGGLRVVVIYIKVSYRQVNDGHYEGRYRDRRGVHQVQIHLVHVQVTDDEAGVDAAVVARVVRPDAQVGLVPHRTVERGRVPAALDVRKQFSTHVIPLGRVAHEARGAGRLRRKVLLHR